MKKKRSSLLVLIILLVLIAAGAFYFLQDRQNDLSENQTPAQTATSAPQAPSGEPAEDNGSQTAETDGMASPQETEETAVIDDQQTGLRIPTFDVLRVEPDGTAVIAGNAEPFGTLDVKENDDTLTSSEVTDIGNFVAIIDTPLKPGTHEIYLQVAMPDGRTVRSEQTATISIPDGNDGDLLAIITEPGKPSEIIAAPQPSAPSQNEPQAETPAASANGEVTAATPSGEAQAAVTPTVRIKAVEIEDNTLFVAGEGEIDATIRGYLDDGFLAETTVNADSNFVIQAEVDVPVGLHNIRVDMLDADGRVIARAVVPFDRPEGNQIAAISSDGSQTAQTNADGTQTFIQPQLQQSNNAVIIRRGDNLWSISRRVYGRGVRYTTIYLANEPQIANPNLILPGQVFSLPRQPLPIGESEDIHRRLLKGENVPPDLLNQSEE